MMQKPSIAYHKETECVTMQGRTVVLENLTPKLSPKARDKRKQEIEQQLFNVFRKYQDKHRP